MNLPIVIVEYEVNTTTNVYGQVSETFTKKQCIKAWVEPYGKTRAQRDYGFEVDSSMRIFTKTLPDKNNVLEINGEKFRVSKIIPAMRGKFISHYEILLEGI